MKSKDSADMKMETIGDEMHIALKWSVLSTNFLL